MDQYRSSLWTFSINFAMLIIHLLSFGAVFVADVPHDLVEALTRDRLPGDAVNAHETAVEARFGVVPDLAVEVVSGVTQDNLLLTQTLLQVAVDRMVEVRHDAVVLNAVALGQIVLAHDVLLSSELRRS